MNDKLEKYFHTYPYFSFAKLHSYSTSRIVTRYSVFFYLTAHSNKSEEFYEIIYDDSIWSAEYDDDLEIMRTVDNFLNGTYTYNGDTLGLNFSTTTINYLMRSDAIDEILKMLEEDE